MCKIFHLWNHVDTQNISGFGAFQIFDAQIRNAQAVFSHSFVQKYTADLKRNCPNNKHKRNTEGSELTELENKTVSLI